MDKLTFNHNFLHDVKHLKQHFFYTEFFKTFVNQSQQQRQTDSLYFVQVMDSSLK